MIQHVYRYALYVCISILDLVVVEMDGRTRYLLRYGTTFGRRRDAGMYACVHVCGAGLGGAVLCWAGLGGAVRCGAVRCGAVLASLSESNETDESTG